MSIFTLKVLQVVLLIGFGVIMIPIIEMMELPKTLIPYFKTCSTVGTTIMIVCAITG